MRIVYIGDTPLWLIVSRRQRSTNALSWDLTNVQGSRSDIPLYQYYMIIAAVALAMAFAHKRRWKPLRIRKRDYFQLNLDLNGF